MKRLIILLMAALLSAISCEKPYQTTVELAVDYSDEHGGLVFKNAKLGDCYIMVTSNTSWTATITEEKWCGFIPKGQVSLTDNRTYRYEGNGTEYIRFSINENYSPASRQVKFTVTSSTGMIKEFTIIQPGATEDD